MSGDALSIEPLLCLLKQMPPPAHILLAYSGGLDSTALLALLAANRGLLPCKLAAVHVNHQLSVNAGQWERHCQDSCRAQGIPCEVVRINVGDSPGNMEARARELRYEALAGCMQTGDVLLTAHHRDDQAETVLLQLLRGAGPGGLAAMPDLRPFGPGWLARPLLGYGRDQIAAYVSGQRLAWVEDESNLRPEQDRNYLRHAVMPVIWQRWPSASTVLQRAAKLQADAASILGDMSTQDLRQARGGSDSVLLVPALKNLSRARLRNLLRSWIRDHGHPVPPLKVMDEIIMELLQSGPDSSPCVRWGRTEIRKYRDEAYLMAARDDAPCANLDWQLDAPLELRDGRLQARTRVGSGIKKEEVQDNVVEVRFRRGGEQLRPAGRRETHTLKKLFQDAGVPPWDRDVIPLIYVRGKLAAVSGYWIAEEFQAGGDEPGWDIVFVPNNQ